MKKIFILLFVLVSLNLLAQTKKKAVKPVTKRQSNIEGIGDFKINKSKLNIIDSLVNSGFKYSEISTFSEQYHLKNQKDLVCLILPDTNKSFQDIHEVQICSDSKVYYLPNLMISNIEIDELYLTFFRGLLVKIECKFSSQILEAFKTKYGESDATEYTKTYNCRVFGNLVPYNETSYYDKWYNKDITATTYFGSFRDSKCDKQYVSYVTIQSDFKMDLVDKCNKKHEDRISIREKLLNKEKYNKF